MLRRQIIFKTSQTNYQAAIANENTDVSIQTQLDYVFGYINKCQVKLLTILGYCLPELVSVKEIL